MGHTSLHAFPPGQDSHRCKWTWRVHGTTNHTTNCENNCGVEPTVADLVPMSFMGASSAGWNGGAAGLNEGAGAVWL
jgi:hypothetical protein